MINSYPDLASELDDFKVGSINWHKKEKVSPKAKEGFAVAQAEASYNQNLIQLVNKVNSDMIRVNYHDAANWLIKRQLVLPQAAVNNLLHSLISRGVVHFFQVEQTVIKIYGSTVENCNRFWIFTSEERYDSALVRRLISIEDEINELFQEVDLSFEFVPLALVDNPLDLIGENPTLLFERV